MSLQVKGVISCCHYRDSACDASAEVLLSLTEAQEYSSDPLCYSRGTGEFLIDPPADNTLPDGWTRGFYSKLRFFCPKHASDAGR